MRNSISIKHGTEGPHHDPYSFTEVTIDGRSGEVIFHCGLGEWTRLPDGTKVDGSDAIKAFEKLTGLHPGVAEESFYKAKSRKIRRHLKACGGHEESSAGYPGETLVYCSTCGLILDCSFNRSAVE